MERLTYRENGWVGVHDRTDGVVSTNSQAVHRLADIEDVLELHEVKDIEELRKMLGFYTFLKTLGVRKGAITTADQFRSKIEDCTTYKASWGELLKYLWDRSGEKDITVAEFRFIKSMLDKMMAIRSKYERK